MTPEPTWRRYLRLVRPNVAADVEDELDFHLAQIAERLIREGTDPATAWARAHQEFGDRAGAGGRTSATISGSAPGTFAGLPALPWSRP